jgi:hypothetical protein
MRRSRCIAAFISFCGKPLRPHELLGFRKRLEFLLAHGGKARQESKIVGRHSDRRGLKNEGHMPEDKYLLMSRSHLRARHEVKVERGP